MRKYIFFLSVILMGACQSPAVFEKYEEQPDEVWNRYHIVEFTADIPDSGQYIVKLCLRHTTDYEMANLWCFVYPQSRTRAIIRYGKPENSRTRRPLVGKRQQH